MDDESLTIDVLRDWTASGGQWRVVDLTGTHVEVDLCACTGESMQRGRSAHPAVIAYVNANRSDRDPPPG